MSQSIVIRGARQNNLKNLHLELPTGELIVVTGVSGSGKSSLVFDTLYAEGQRRYVETFSPYARQFLDRMDRPQVERIDGIPPAIAIDQTNPVRTSRSTVGTMTELNDHLKLLFSRAAQVYCRQCSAPVKRDSAQSIYAELSERLQALGRSDARVIVTFPVPVPANFGEAEVLSLLEKQGYTRLFQRITSTVAATEPAKGKKKAAKKGRKNAEEASQTSVVLEMIQDRFRFDNTDRERVIEALESALRVGRDRVAIHVLEANGGGRSAENDVTPPATSATWRFSSDLHCADCDIHYREPTPSLFSFNSPLGACDACRGFGRIIGIDFGRIIPDQSKTLKGGAVRPWQTESYRECQDDLIKYARKRNIPIDVPWRELTEEQRQWVLEGEGSWEDKLWYGVRRFFAWLETKSYKMHVRVLLSKYRAYTPCTVCDGARLKTDALLWRLGTKADAKAVLPDALRFKPNGVQWNDAQLAELPGIGIHELMLLPIDRCKQFFDRLALPAPLDEASDLVLREIRGRFGYLLDVGLGYLTLDRQSRTLSGGEVQRINLTTALGTSLVNTLFVLDEPSIGLHPRDMGRVINVMHRLKAAGNSLVVVEHDPQVMQAADKLIDVGPGPGEKGGEIVFFGEPAELAKAERSLTADYLLGRKQVSEVLPDAAQSAPTAALTVKGARQHNLKGIDVSIPLQRLVCVTGVSGSGKSTLIQDVLYPALLKHFGKPTEAPGEHDSIKGAENISAVVMVDQTSIGRTTRSNPASYVGAFDAIRKLFANEPLAKERDYTIGTFSFNSGNGRCPTCGGNGFEHVEMQFLSDVYLRCADCNGRRYRGEILEIKLNRGPGPGRSIADVLDMTVSEAVEFFAGEREVLSTLRPLAEVGLDYLRLGQPVPTLSGGEAQRLKLAGHLAESATARSDDDATPGKLFLFDEPTTGLHFDDIAKLLRAFRRLIAAGHSLLVIEHNLDVIAASDWLIDLGPEGGEAGGEIIAVGTPADLMKVPGSHTGKALREVQSGWKIADQRTVVPLAASAHRPKSNVISIHGAREHNLKNVDVELPRDKFIVVTGVSGSGKSTLAFDIVFGEGQRRYLESLNAYARQFVQPASRPDVDAIFGIPPTVAIEQRTSRGGRKSTVATLTEIYHFLRLLYVKLGTQYCPDCDVPIEPQSFESIFARISRDYRGKSVSLLAPLVVARKGFYTDLAAWALKKGYEQLRVDGELLPTQSWPRLSRFQEHTIELPVATVQVSARNERELREALTTALDFGKGVVHLLDESVKVKKAPVAKKAAKGSTAIAANAGLSIFSTRRACPSCAKSFAELDPRLFSFNSKHGWCEDCYGTGLQIRGFDEEQSGEEIWWNEWFEQEAEVCDTCEGERLNPIARNVRFRDQSIAAVTAQSVGDMRKQFNTLKLKGREGEIARDVLTEIHSRLAFLEDVGLGYLALDRSAPTLSGGEAQRIRLAAQLGSNLQGVCYILDEPTIGLHPRDNRILLDTLDKLAAKGNSLLVVEHDEETIRRADYVLDLGPGAGTRGGRVVAAGTAEELERSPESITGRLLAQPLQHPIGNRRAVTPKSPALVVKDASLHNLRKQTCKVPLDRLVVVTGVSGSGKSTMARDVLHDNLRAALGRRRGAKLEWRGCKEIAGWEQIERILEVDQTPIGKTPRSCPATYIGFWDAIRKVFAETPEARMRGYTPSRFSFNTAGGRCEACEGQGMRKIEMSFLPDVRVSCDSCGGRRFNQDTLSVQYKGKSIGDVLMMSIDEAVDFFTAHPRIHHCLRLLQDVGLGYLTLGQQSPTLSGGEAQRIKLVTELSKVRESRRLRTPEPGEVVEKLPGTLYVLDEPTVGLHMADVEKLIRVLHRLVDAGNTVVVIEHDLDVIAEADWIIDLGPEGGAEGGKVVVQASPDDILRSARESHTARILKEFLRDRAQATGAKPAVERRRTAC
ncbi:excinuclease ABC subunit UvrA [Peristeroidobacter soli]|uniref:excinuclease ABC subunit UvrA n=1 Tax=Peristeroidobacter soli TaxID=2497877 RepID=UPI00101D1A0A|nr:excinuclease ABC subunit UvrA [Peristeroidobacter soli]